MIIKMKKDHHDGWLFRDGIKEVQTYQLFDETPNGSDDKYKPFKSLEELVQGVSRMWGSWKDRESSFASELWPDWPIDEKGVRQAYETTALVIRAEQMDGSLILVVATAPTYLLGDDGKTIERLR